ncbi:MAG: kinase/pyrophosphorylase [Synergistales bacterium]|nr:kinase/pyrophosphorylase [Synergistales bacterium]
MHYSEDNPLEIFVVSDFTGETIETVTRAATRQFPNGHTRIRRFRYINSESRARRVLEEALDNKAIIACTLVDHDVRTWFINKAAVMGLKVIDVLGPVMDLLSDTLQMSPLEKPGLAHQMDEAYFKRVKAVEFSIACDDGSNSHMLPEAELVIVGVSRTCKTPLSMYLAHKGIMTANIPLVPNLEPPQELFGLDPQKVVGLTIKASKLQQVRKERLQMMGLDPETSAYAKIDKVEDEIGYAKKIMKQVGCKIFDVTDKAIEETAQEVITYLHLE